VFGRDILSRIIWGGRVSLFTAGTVVIISGFLGIILGLVAAYYEGPIRIILTWLMNVMLSLPALLLALAIVAILGPGIIQTIIAMSIVYTSRFARLQRSLVLSVKETDFIRASRCIGASDLRIMIRHILPNTIAPIVVMATLTVAQAILLESALSFIGLGVQPPTATWGFIVSEGRKHLQNAPWVSMSAGMMIFITSMALNLLGDALRDALDPRVRGERTFLVGG
jgi:ABC-type dipeptide/oligopeptide/nickel transport system permease subunit